MPTNGSEVPACSVSDRLRCHLAGAEQRGKCMLYGRPHREVRVENRGQSVHDLREALLAPSTRDPPELHLWKSGDFGQPRQGEHAAAASAKYRVDASVRGGGERIRREDFVADDRQAEVEDGLELAALH